MTRSAVPKHAVEYGSFFSSLKKDLIHRRSWPTREETASAVHEYIEVFYNRYRRHTTLKGKSPASFESLYEKNLTQAA